MKWRGEIDREALEAEVRSFDAELDSLRQSRAAYRRDLAALKAVLPYEPGTATDRAELAASIEETEAAGAVLDRRLARLVGRRDALLEWLDSSQEILTPPGSRLRHWLRALVGRRFYDEVIGQTIADAQSEWLEAHTRGEVQAARLIHLRMLVQLAAVLGRGCLGGLVRTAIGIFKSG